MKRGDVWAAVADERGRLAAPGLPSTAALSELLTHRAVALAGRRGAAELDGPGVPLLLRTSG